MMKNRRIFAFTTAVCMGVLSLTLGFPAQAAEGVSSAIEIDGAAKDWDREGISPVAPPTPDNNDGVAVTGFRAAKDQGGDLYLCFEGNITSGEYSDLSLLEMELNGQRIQLSALLNDEAVTSVCNYDSAAPDMPFVLEMRIPADYFSGEDSTLSFGGASFRVDMLPLLSEAASVSGADASAYTGIAIDGSFADWDGVNKTAVTAVNGEGVGCLEEAAMVFDGGYVYLYLKEAVTNGAVSAGPQSKGQYHILTDLGNTLTFQLKRNGTVSGVDGAEARHVGNRWELSLPAEALPAYNETLSFGTDPEAPILSNVANVEKGVANLGPVHLALAAEDAGIVIDGTFGDWSDYPHTYLSGVSLALGRAAVYITEDNLFVHTTASNINLGSLISLQSLLGNAEFSVNGDKGGGSQTISLSVVTADGQTLDSLKSGDHTLYIYDTATGHPDSSSEIIANALGVMKIHIGSGFIRQHELEAGIDLDKVAPLLGVDAADIKTAEFQLPGLGTQWIEISGISSGPWLGAALALAIAGSAVAVRKRKKGSTV